MSALALLCEIIAHGERVSVEFYSQKKALIALLSHGYLQKAGLMGSVVCTVCDEVHAAPIVYQDARYGYFCPDSGFVAVDPAQLSAVQPDIPFLIKQMAEAFNCRRRKTSAIHGRTWRIGAIEAHSDSVVLYFCPTVRNGDDVHDLQNDLSREPRSRWRLIVTAQGTVPLSDAVSVCLDDLVDLDIETGVLRVITDPAILAGVPRKNTGGRPSEYGQSLRVIVEERLHKGEALEGLNAETRAVRSTFKARYPDSPVPSEATVKRYVKDLRGG